MCINIRPPKHEGGCDGRREEDNRSIYSVDDVVCLQMDLDILSQWASDWRMAFNLDKCKHLVITNIRSPLCSEYKINNHYIHKVSHAK